MLLCPLGLVGPPDWQQLSSALCLPQYRSGLGQQCCLGRRVMQHAQKAAGQAQTDFVFPLHVPSRSELPAALRKSLLGFKQKAQETCTDTFHFRLLEGCITVQLTESCLSLFSPLSVFFPHCAQVTSFFSPLCLSQSSTPELCRIALGWISFHSWPHTAGSPVSCKNSALPMPKHPCPQGSGHCKPGHWLHV